MREIIQSILRSPVPVVTYVYPTGSRAASAGFFILLSADVAAMSPGTETGAASPLMEIGGSPVQIDDTLRKKIVNDATAYLRSYTSKRERNPELAATAVTDAKAFSDKEALDGKLVEIVTASKEDLLAQLNGRTIARFDGAKLHARASASANRRARNDRPRKISLAHRAARRIFHPADHRCPGHLRGVHASRRVRPRRLWRHRPLARLYAMHMLPVSLAGLLLIACAFVLFILEAKFPTHGVLGVGGVVSMVLGALFLITSPMTGMGVSLWTALAVVIPFAIIVIILMRLVLRSRTWKVSTGREELIGEVGEVREPVGSGEAWQRSSRRNGAACTASIAGAASLRKAGYARSRANH